MAAVEGYTQDQVDRLCRALAWAGGNEASAAFFQAMADAGVHVHLFEPTRHFFTLRLNVFRRLHRKLVVVDNEVAFIGGINYCADQLSSFGEEAKQDYSVCLRGPVVQDIHQACLDLLRHGETKARPFWRRTKIAKAPGNSTDGARVLLTVRDNGVHKRDIEKYYLNAIHSAKERLVLAHAYFFPSYGLLRALRNAARRSSMLPPSPNNVSNTMRGCASAGSGVVGDDQERLFW